jgi:hypothetical protein
VRGMVVGALKGDQRNLAMLFRLDAERHGFQLQCLPGCFAGRLRTAPLVLLYLSPGFSEDDVADAQSEDGKDYRLRSWQGNEPFRDHGPGRSWLESRTKDLLRV